MTKYYITSGDKTICKCFVMGNPIYQLWVSGEFVAQGSLEEMKKLGGMQ